MRRPHNMAVGGPWPFWLKAFALIQLGPRVGTLRAMERPLAALADARWRTAGAVGSAARGLWRRGDLQPEDLVVVDLLAEALVRDPNTFFLYLVAILAPLCAFALYHTLALVREARGEVGAALPLGTSLQPTGIPKHSKTRSREGRVARLCACVCCCCRDSYCRL